MDREIQKWVEKYRNRGRVEIDREIEKLMEM